MKFEKNFSATGGGEQTDEKSNEEKIAELEKRREGITAFNDITSEDRRILEEIDQEIERIEGGSRKKFDGDATVQIVEVEGRGTTFEEEKKKLFAKIDIYGGAYSPTLDRDYTPTEIKGIIEDVLTGKREVREVPRSPMAGTDKNLREHVLELKEMQ